MLYSLEKTARHGRGACRHGLIWVLTRFARKYILRIDTTPPFTWNVKAVDRGTISSMFESICIRRQHPFELSEPLDVGFLAEAMLFYQSVHLIADGSTISQLLREFGPHLLMELLKEEFLKISYVEKIIGVAPSDAEISKRVYLPLTLHPANGTWSLETIAPENFSKAASGPGWGRQLGREFAG